jgi:hypothetical protein
MTDRQRRNGTETGNWPEPTDEQVEVLLLGVYHMANPGQDVVNVEADDVLAPTRQEELVELADCLERWNPDAIAVEYPRTGQEHLDRLYEEFRDGTHAYDEELALDESHPLHDEPISRVRSETIQVGFRLAERTGLERLLADDSSIRDHLDIDDEAADQFDLEAATRRGLSTLEVELPDLEAGLQAEQEHLDQSTIVDHLHWINREDALHDNHDLMFAAALAGVDEADADLGVGFLAGWYARNIQTVANIWHMTDEDTDRVVKIVGTGHVHVLRHLLDEAPMFCPVSPLGVLSD